MKTIVKSVLLTAGLILIGIQVKAQQDAQFTQYMFNGLYINPAYAGYKEQTYLHSFYRNQWTGVEGAPQTMTLAADMVRNHGKVGLGVLFLSDRIGSQSNISAYANYAYRLQAGSSEFSRLAFGLGVGVAQLGLNDKYLDPNDADHAIPAGGASGVYPDARAGIYYTTPRFFAGLSADNLLVGHFQAKGNSSILLPRTGSHLYLTAGTLFPISKDLKAKTSFLLKDDRHSRTSLDLNAFMLLKEAVWLGAFYRTAIATYRKPGVESALQKKNAMGIITEIYATETLRAGYAFDYSFSHIGQLSYGSHEISIGLALSRVRREGPKCYF
jgi:type IX secretion system PorP/SprF family membrane protein